MIPINKDIALSQNEIKERFILSSGPGGQNVNKVATAVQLSFNIQNSLSLPDELKHRMIELYSNKINKNGELIITARRFRHLEQNRKDALQRLLMLIRDATAIPQPRLKKNPPPGRNEKRLDAKRFRGRIKKNRQQIKLPDQNSNF